MSRTPALPIAVLLTLALAACGGSNASYRDDSPKIRTGPQELPLTASPFGDIIQATAP